MTLNTRTLSGHLVELLEYPRWFIERDVDFSGCRHNGHFDPAASNCTECEFGAACRWLDQHRTPDLTRATLDELVIATETAVAYLAGGHQHERGCQCHPCRWLREARQFLRGIAHHK